MSTVRQAILRRLEFTRAELDDLVEDVVLVGGAAPATFEFDVRGAEIRPTADVDIVIRGGYREWAAFQAALRQRSFRHDPQHHTSRMVKDDLLLDIMPTEDAGLATNRWYESAFANRVYSDELGLYVLRPVDFLATKLEAFNAVGREGHGDYAASRDIEDVLGALAYMAALREEVAAGQEPVHRFVRYELSRKLARLPDALTIIQGHLDGDDASQARAGPLVEWMRGL